MGRSSLIDDPNFFLAPDGDTDPKAELDATLKAFLKDPTAEREDEDEHEYKPNRHPLCRFPARKEFIQNALALPDSAFTSVDCPDRDAFMNNLAYERVSLVFAHYFINSPQSMFGHTFLRLHAVKPHAQNNKAAAKAGSGKTKRVGTNSPLLDDVVNFSAQVPPEDVNGPFYAISGLLGGYRGRFQLMPYYQKVQEYNNLESRDLWEYPLDLSKAQITSIQKILWELGDSYINYYFLTENCSYALLGMLETVLPNDRLTSEFPLVAIPADTLRAVVESPTRREAQLGESAEAMAEAPRQEIVAKYRPSGLARYLWQAEQLRSDKERQSIGALVSSADAKPSDSSTYESCDVGCKIRLLETAIEYIDFNKRVGANAKAGDLSALRGRLLASRANLPALAPVGAMSGGAALRKTPVSDPPHLGHGTSTIGLGSLRSNDDEGITGGYLHFRPALQDISGNPRGYSDQMEIRFFDLWLDLSRSRSRSQSRSQQRDQSSNQSSTEQHIAVDVGRFSLVRILSLPDSSVMLSPLAWSFDLGFEPFATTKSAKLRHRSHLSVSVGKSFRQHGTKPWLRPYVLVGAKAYNEYKADQQGLAPFASLGMTVAKGRIPARLALLGTIGSNFDRITNLNNQGEVWQQLEGVLAVDINRNLEARLYGEAYSRHSNWRLGLEYYF